MLSSQELSYLPGTRKPSARERGREREREGKAGRLGRNMGQGRGGFVPGLDLWMGCGALLCGERQGPGALGLIRISKCETGGPCVP